MKESGFELYDGRKIKPMLMKIAKERGRTYQEVKDVFIKEIDKPAVKALDKALQELGERL